MLLLYVGNDVQFTNSVGFLMKLNGKLNTDKIKKHNEI